MPASPTNSPTNVSMSFPRPLLIGRIEILEAANVDDPRRPTRQDRNQDRWMHKVAAQAPADFDFLLLDHESAARRLVVGVGHRIGECHELERQMGARSVTQDELTHCIVLVSHVLDGHNNPPLNASQISVVVASSEKFSIYRRWFTEWPPFAPNPPQSFRKRSSCGETSSRQH